MAIILLISFVIALFYFNIKDVIIVMSKFKVQRSIHQSDDNEVHQQGGLQLPKPLRININHHND